METTSTMTRQDAHPYVSFVIDTARDAYGINAVDDRAILVGWQCECEPLFVAVIGATVDTAGRRDKPDVDTAVEIAANYLDDRGWFAPTRQCLDPDHVFD